MAGEGIPRVAKQVLGDFPASLDRNDYSGQIRGELWQIDSESLKNCDRLEGHPTFYKREQIPVTLDKDRSRHTAWLYFIVEPFRGHLCFAKNKSGVLEWPSERQYRMSRHA
jgi:gamma-glutamylcyclotransferase (GGCT)/AIG2-like uncharacterized protein YtfP